MKRQMQLFWAFFRVGMLGYGGGPSSIPLVQKEAVERYRWMDDDEFADILAVGNSLPGPIATKLAGYIGYRVGGFLGMINATLATTLPTIMLMILLLSSLSAFKDQPWVNGMTKAVTPVVGVMLGVLTYEFFQKGNEGLGVKKNLLLIAASLLLLQFLHPAFVIAGLLLYAVAKRDGASREAGRDGRVSP